MDDSRVKFYSDGYSDGYKAGIIFMRTEIEKLADKLKNELESFKCEMTNLNQNKKQEK